MKATKFKMTIAVESFSPEVWSNLSGRALSQIVDESSEGLIRMDDGDCVEI